ncbi:MAG: 23S rRNA (uracil(1939)-C(5))-methyltransferase RlmD [Desulfobulbaceae bacterium]|nr:23S rRNA (uracil(1939)-C(5))-methyltransferase RlmD [Desulfobulbaceae bacterium]
MSTLQIEKLVIGGLGLGRTSDGKVVMVPHVLPGEKVEVMTVHKTKKYTQAEAVHILEPSPDRVSPPCPHFGECGGCDFQHVLPEKQAYYKNFMFQEQLERFSFQADMKDRLLTPIASPLTFHYRQRIKLRISKNGKLGFYRSRSHDVEQVSICLLARKEINEVLNSLNSSSVFYEMSSHLSSLELRLSPVDEQVVGLFHMTRKPRPADKKRIEKLISDCSRLKSVVVLATDYGMVGMYPVQNKPEAHFLHFEHLLPSDDKLHMDLEPGGFSQVNLAQNENLIALVLEWLMDLNKGTALDLFCGMGNFSLPLAQRGMYVRGMDLQRSAIRSAKRNAERNGLSEKCIFAKSSARDGAEGFAKAGEKFDLVLLDPPRQGCNEVVPFLSHIAARQVIYISCDPATLCRDLVQLEKEGFQVEKIKVVDMFPQTHHLETVVSLMR